MSVDAGGQGASSQRPRLKSVKITNFRAIASAEIEFGESVALVGQNGSGKTTVLRALNAFFNFESEERDFAEGRHKFTSKSQSVIEVCLVGLQGSGLPMSNSDAGEVRAKLKYRAAKKWECWTNGAWAAMPADFHDRLKAHLTFALIPIRRDHEVAHNSSEGLLERAVEQWVLTNHIRDRRSPQIAKVGKDLQNRSLSGLQRHLRTIAPMSGPFSFEFEYSTPPDYRLLLQNIQLSVKEGGQLIALSDSGSGTQSMAVFALYAYLAELQQTNYILGFEEPEQNLHPQAQQQLMANLSGLGLQVIFTTHSPTIVDTLGHEQVVLCKRARSPQRELVVQITQIKSAFFADHGLDRDSYYKFHRRRNSQFLFADFVVVTESPIDSSIVEQLLVDAGQSPSQLGMSVFALDGVTALPHMFHLLRQLKIPHVFVVDKDYLVPYRNNNVRRESLDSRGFPRYKAELKPKSLLPDLFPKTSDLEELLEALVSNHAKAAKLLQGVGFFCFRYALEVDLVAAPTTRERLYDRTGLEGENRTEEALLAKTSALKDQSYLLHSIAGVPVAQIPHSFKRLRSQLPALARAARPN